MAIPGWTHAASPFHEGELAIQARLGVQDRMDKQGRRVIRDFLPDQHRQFFTQLPYVIVGSVDADQRPWASVLVGEPGFISSPSDRTLHIAAQTLFGDPLAQQLVPGAEVGILGIELPTRRRNRINGVITSVDSQGFEVAVQQSFGNCPQYIQARQSILNDFNISDPKPVYALTELGVEERSLIARADTFFITTAYQFDSLVSGVDVSHRGGQPGFIKIENAKTFVVPDFSGNNHFNTFGNLALNPRAGLLFIDFQQGDLVYLTGTAEVLWDSCDRHLYPGAERLLRFSLDKGYRVVGSLPLRWSEPEVSPFLEGLGPWATPSIESSDQT